MQLHWVHHNLTLLSRQLWAMRSLAPAALAALHQAESTVTAHLPRFTVASVSHALRHMHQVCTATAYIVSVHWLVQWKLRL